MYQADIVTQKTSDEKLSPIRVKAENEEQFIGELNKVIDENDFVVVTLTVKFTNTLSDISKTIRTIEKIKIAM